MSGHDRALFDELRRLKRELTGQPLAGLTDEEFTTVKAFVVRWEAHQKPKPPQRLPTARPASEALLTLPVALEIISHEAIVQEAYKDSVGVWTWGVGITNASGHQVHPRYKDNPQTIERCLEVFIWALKANYIPAVVEAFGDRALTEAQFAAALSFHYNTGAIKRATWVRNWRDGKIAEARRRIMDWNKPPEIVGRRGKERDLFFDGKWSNDGKATVYPVRKPSYAPDWAKAKRVDVRSILEGLLR